MAFRIVREFVPKPVLMILCDHPNGCSEVASCTVGLGRENDIANQLAFIQTIRNAGWGIGMSHRCPQHNIIEQANKQRVILPMSS